MELERQNDRLEQFVDTVSHNLRNTLNVADGHLALSIEECDSDHLATVGSAIEQMEKLIEDLLTLARQGATPAELERVSLGDVVEASWGNVDTAEATLRIARSVSIQADRSRLMHLFENLIRNAIEHGGEKVAVTVGTVEDGFYVEDDGPGIAPGDREAVFDSGYSTSPDGTGFGLIIVEEIVDAHGWTVRVTDSESGGAPFEITGCRLLDSQNTPHEESDG
jgi:signal transduction histidine kinase